MLLTVYVMKYTYVTNIEQRSRLAVSVCDCITLLSLDNNVYNVSEKLHEYVIVIYAILYESIKHVKCHPRFDIGLLKMCDYLSHFVHVRYMLLRRVTQYYPCGTICYNFSFLPYKCKLGIYICLLIVRTPPPLPRKYENDIYVT